MNLEVENLPSLRSEKNNWPNKSQKEDRQFPKNNVSKMNGCSLHE